MSYRLTAEAERDLDDIFYTGAERFGLPHAERYAQGLMRTLAFLAEYPAATRLRTEIEPPTRAYPYKAHLIIYDVDVDGDVIVVRLRHGREDWLSDPRGLRT